MRKNQVHTAPLALSVALLSVTVPAVAQGPVSDDFYTGTLNAGLWTFVNPVGGTYAMTGSNLLLQVPGGANHDPGGGVDNAVRVMQNISNVDFQVDVKFDSVPSAQYSNEGLIIEQDAHNYIRFEVYSSGSQLSLYSSTILSSVETTILNKSITVTGASVWLRLNRSGSTWTGTWSADGTTFQTGMAFSQSLTIARIGPFGSNYNATASNAPAFTASVDYFFNDASPISPVNGGGPNISLVTATTTATSATLKWTTNVSATTVVRYGLTTSYGQSYSDSTPVTSHSATLAGLTCGTTYNYAATSALSGGSTTSPNGTFTTPACATAPAWAITKSHPGNFQQGGSGTYTLRATNSGTAVTNGTATVTDTLPGGLTATAMNGTGWTCTLTPTLSCTRSDALAAGASYPAITLTVNVASNAPSSVTNSATVSGGGASGPSSASDPTTITGGVPDLTISKTHTGNFTQGGTGSYTLTISNAGTTPTAGTVTVADTLPTGLTASSIAGTGWSCTITPTLGCTRSDALAGGGSYPAIILTTKVATGAPSSVTNTAAVSGGGETNTSNDSASDVTTIVPASPNIVSDDFDSPTLDTGLWTLINPVGDATLTATGTNIVLFLPAGSNHDAWVGGVNNSVRLMQPAANQDFGVEVKFETAPTAKYQNEGLQVAQDSTHFLRFEVYNDGVSPHIFAGTQNGTAQTANYNAAITSAGPPIWIRVTRSGNTWTQQWSTNGTTYNTAATFTQTLTVTSVGPYAGNYGSPAPALTASIDYFFNTAAPIIPEDGGNVGIITIQAAPGVTNAAISWTTDRGATSQIVYGPTTAYGSSTALDSTLVTQHSQGISGLTCNATYHFEVVSADAGGVNKTASADRTFTTSACPSGGPTSDDFTSTSLNTSVWTFVNPLNDGSVTVSGGAAVITVPAGPAHDAWTTGDNTVRIMQTIANTDFEVEAKFTSVVTSQYQIQGIIIEQDYSNFLRVDVHQADCQTALFITQISGTSYTTFTNARIRNGPNVYLRVKRTGNTWNVSYSYDSQHWTPAPAFTATLTVNRIGPFGGNNGPNGGSAPPFTAQVDYFINRVTPPSTVNGQAYPPANSGPAITVWYGNNQTFGSVGVPQQWVNILGNVSGFYGIASLGYTLNGGPLQTLWTGENEFRLVAPGNFNVEIDYASLNPGANTVRIIATDNLGSQATSTVTVNHVAGTTWPANYTINWTPGTNIQSVAQIVDGQWQVQSDGTVRTMETGYDRLIAVGDRSWTTYDVLAQVRLNALDCHDFGAGIVVGWQGHTTLQYGVPLPDQPRTGHPFPGLGWYSMETAPSAALNIYENTTSAPETYLIRDTSGMTLQTGVNYYYRFRVTHNTSGGSHYALKVWQVGSTEPAAWNLEADGELSQGSAIIGAHRADMSVGQIVITAQ